MNKPLIQSAQQAARPLDVGGFKITVLASTEQTGGYELFRIAGPEGTGPGPHHHDWDESFFVLSGAVHCGVDSDVTLATTGALIKMRDKPLPSGMGKESADGRAVPAFTRSQ